MATAAPPAPTGPAHVAVVSFLAARAAPTGGFWIALAGGVALARVAERRGARAGFGASVAAMLETVAIIGPARFGIPLTQAVTAPLLGRLEARVEPVPAAADLRHAAPAPEHRHHRLLHLGDHRRPRRLRRYLRRARAAPGDRGGYPDALALTAAGLVVWAVFASVVQVLVYRRGLRRWDELAEAAEGPGEPAAGSAEVEPAPVHRGRFDPRAIALASAVAFGLLLASTEWIVLGAVGAWLALAWATARGDREPVPIGLIFAAILGLGALVFTLGGGLGLDLALRRALRAALIVLVATWLRAAAGADGLREVFRRVLGRLRAIPSLPEATEVLDGIAAEGRLVAAARSLADRLRGVDLRPLPLVDAVLEWVVGEAHAFRPLPLAAARYSP